MKIVVVSRYPKDPGCPKGGVESVTVVLVRALAQMEDLDVHVVTFDSKGTAINIEQYDELTVHRLPGSCWPQILDIWIGPGRKSLLNYVKRLAPDVLHTHETYGLALGTISIPHVFTIHGFDHANLIANSAPNARLRSWLWKSAERKGMAEQRHIISITPYVREMIEPLTKARIYDIDNPVDERFFRIETQREPGRVLCVGWLNERKNTLGSVEAFACVARNCRYAKLVIAGEARDHEYFHRIQQRITQYELSDRVEILGHVDHNRLERELARASVFLLPSRQENSPMAIAEAMAIGVATIASNCCGMPYMIEEGQTGYLIDPESTDQIADRLNKLVNSPQLCAQMGQAGRQLALERFHPHNVAEKTRAVYRQVIVGRSQNACVLQK